MSIESLRVQTSPVQTTTGPAEQVQSIIKRIPALDEAAMAAARARQATLTKPAGALGRLETLSIQLAGITGQATPRLEKKAVLIMAADHGVAAEGVSPYPQAVTAQMVANFLNGGAAINVMARAAGANLIVVDLGIATPFPPHINLNDSLDGTTCFIRRPIAPGTANLLHGPAMTQAQALAALAVGIETVEAAVQRGLDLLGMGEMGIGNTTAAAAIACALTGQAPAALVGRGAGLDDAGVAHKVNVVRRALDVNASALHQDSIAILAALGGFEIAGLAGAMLAAAAHRVPVIIDGYIATAAALIAVQLAPALRAFLIAAHCSAEQGHAAMLAWLGLEPYLHLDMRLGEGTGAALSMGLVDAAWQTLAHMATFEDAGVAGKSGALRQGF